MNEEENYDAIKAAMSKRIDRCVLQSSLDGEVLNSERGLLPLSATEQVAVSVDGPQWDRPSHDEAYQ